MSTKLKNLSDFSHTTIPNAEPFKFAIIVAEWNAAITSKLYEGAYQSLIENGAKESNITSIQVPGSYELTSAAQLLAQKNFNAIICLGCVIQGETKHFDFICHAVATGLNEVATKHNKPIIFGVLTTDNEQQALDRAGGKHGNKGIEAAVTAIKMSELYKVYN